MKAWIGSLIYKCIRAHDNREAAGSLPRESSRRSRTLQERLEHNMPSLVAFRIENGFVVETESGMVFCKGAQEIAEAVVNAEAKQKLGIKKAGVLSSNTATINGGF